MAKDFAKAFYNSNEWRRCRAAFVKSKGGLCEDCLKIGIIKAGKVVHHIEHLTADNITDPSVSLSWDNLKLVCQDCHAKEHDETIRFLYDAEGNLIEV